MWITLKISSIPIIRNVFKHYNSKPTVKFMRMIPATIGRMKILQRIFNQRTRFTRSEIINFQNVNIWPEEYPHAIQITTIFYECMGGTCECMGGTCEWDAYCSTHLIELLVGALYLEILQNNLLRLLLDEIPLNIWQDVIFIR